MLAILLLSLASIHSAPPPPGGAKVVVTAARPSAEQVAVLLEAMRPRQASIDAEIALFDRAAPAAFLADKEQEDLEAEHPGLTAKLIAATRGVLVGNAAASEDRLRERFRAILTRDLTEADVLSLTDFYTSSAGIALVEQATKGAGEVSSEQFAALVKTDEVKSSQLAKVKAESIKGIRLTALQQAAIVRFLETSGGKALARIQPKFLAFQTAALNEEDPEMDAQIEKAVAKVFEEVLGPKT